MDVNAILIAALNQWVAPTLSVLASDVGLLIGLGVFVLFKGWQLFCALVLDHDMGRHTR